MTSLNKKPGNVWSVTGICKYLCRTFQFFTTLEFRVRYLLQSTIKNCGKSANLFFRLSSKSISFPVFKAKELTSKSIC